MEQEPSYHRDREFIWRLFRQIHFRKRKLWCRVRARICVLGQVFAVIPRCRERTKKCQDSVWKPHYFLVKVKTPVTLNT